MKKVIAAGLALALFSLTAPVGAQNADDGPYTTVDEVRSAEIAIYVKGVDQGTTTATWHTYQVGTAITAQKIADLDRCHRALLLALAKPGQYVARIGTSVCSVALANP